MILQVDMAPLASGQGICQKYAKTDLELISAFRVQNDQKTQPMSFFSVAFLFLATEIEKRNRLQIEEQSN